jgi:uncharacterized membrane protein YhaH (DUF805 family)
MGFPDLLFSAQGRINRGNWWIGLIILIVFSFAMGWVLWNVQGTAMFFTFTGRLMSFILALAVMFVGFCLNAKRFQDRNKPKDFAYIALGLNLLKALSDLFRFTGDPWVQNSDDTMFQVALVLVGLWYIVELGFLSGTAGPNDYGPDPLSEAPRFPEQPAA